MLLDSEEGRRKRELKIGLEVPILYDTSLSTCHACEKRHFLPVRFCQNFY